MSKGGKIAISAALGLLAALFGMLYLSTQKDKLLGSSEVVRVYVAAQNIPANVVIEKDMVTLREIPRTFLQPGSIAQSEVPDPANIKGVTVVPVAEGEQLLRSKLREGADPPLSRDLKPRAGMVAVGVQIVGAAPAINGLIRAGDRVDVLASFRFEKSQNEDFTEVRPLLNDIEVMAVNEATVSTVKSYTPPKDKKDEDTTIRVDTITLALPPAAAQQVILAQQLGRITLLLRGDGDHAPHRYEVWNNERLLQSPYRLWKGSQQQDEMSGARPR